MTEASPTGPEHRLDRDRRMLQFLDQVPVAVFVIDAAGVHVYSNQASTQLLGIEPDVQLSADDMARAHPLFLAGTDDVDSSQRALIVRALAGESVYAQGAELARPDGTTVLVEMWASPITDEHGDVIYAAVGVLAWYTLLSSRIEPRAAFAAVHGWLGDSAVAFTRADSICARATIVTAGPDAQARFADALLDWTKQSAADSAKVVRTGNNVELTVCSGGQKVTAVGNELDLFVLRNAATAAAATDRDVTVARCETESLIAITNRNDIAALHDPAVAGPKLQEMAARCTA